MVLRVKAPFTWRKVSQFIRFTRKTKILLYILMNCFTRKTLVGVNRDRIHILGVKQIVLRVKPIVLRVKPFVLRVKQK